MRLSILLLASVLLAGCASQPAADVGGPAQVEPLAAAPGTPAALASTARFVANVSIDHVLWFNDTFTATQIGGPIMQARDLAGLPPENIRRTDVSEHVPIGVPTLLHLQVDAALSEGDLDIWFNMPDQWVWDGTWDTPAGGYSRIELVVVRLGPEPITANVMYDEPDGPNDVPYVLEFGAFAQPDILLGGMGALVDVAAGATTLRFETEEAGPDAGVMVFDPSDTFLGRFPLANGVTDVPLGPAAPVGEYAIIVAHDAARVRVSVPGATSAPAMRPVGWEAVVGAGAASPDGRMEWSFTAARVPIQIGMFVSPDAVSDEIAFRIASSEGVILEGAFDSGELPWLRAEPIMNVGFGDFSHVAAPYLVPGEYTATAELGSSAGNDGASATEVLVFHKR